MDSHVTKTDPKDVSDSWQKSVSHSRQWKSTPRSRLKKTPVGKIWRSNGFLSHIFVKVLFFQMNTMVVLNDHFDAFHVSDANILAVKALKSYCRNAVVKYLSPTRFTVTGSSGKIPLQSITKCLVSTFNIFTWVPRRVLNWRLYNWSSPKYC